MDFHLKKLARAQLLQDKSSFLLALCTGAELDGADAKSPQWLQQAAAALKAGLWQARAGQTFALGLADATGKPRAMLVVCTGEGRADDVRKSVRAGLAALKPAKTAKITLHLGVKADAATLAAGVQAAAEAAYVFTATKPSAQRSAFGEVVLALDQISGLQVAFDQACALAAGVELAREWANRPGNHATATDLAQAATELAERHVRMGCEVLGPKEVARLKMGAFMAVAQGSEQPLRFIVLHYNGGVRSEAPVVLVGKGITFDTGGISLKPGAEMDEMKFDMSGAASVLGTFEAIGRIRPRINLVGLIPACDNMPSGRAVKPGDVVTSMSGQTIEILNTDAEGRLILCDALTYAERFKPRAVVDIATLTGACVIALGAVRHGMYASDEALAGQLEAAANQSRDLCWRMPLDDDYAEGLKSNFADVANVAGRAAGSVTAAKFLQRFAKAYPWAHLDIAGTAWKSGAGKGATGRPVPLLTRFVLNMASQ